MRNNETNIRFFSRYDLIKGSRIILRSIKEAMRIIDSQEAEYNYAKKKFGYQADFIDADAIASFTTKMTMTSITKCANAFNHYGVRNELINRQLVRSEC